MPQTYCRDDPVSGRWSGVNRLLTEYEVDDNFYTLIQRVVTLEDNTHNTVSIDFITLSGTDLTFHMTDHTVRGPFTIPLSQWRPLGAWSSFTSYAIADVVDINGTLYLVVWPHVSAATFNAGANDGLGHNYYAALLTIPGNSLPPGGAVNQYLRKSDGHDYMVTWGYPIPVGGPTGYMLTKTSSTDFDTQWVAPPVSVSALSDLSDVFVNDSGNPLVTGQFLEWNGSVWVNTTLVVTFADISDISLTTRTVGDLLTWDGSRWTNEQPTLPSVLITSVSTGQVLTWDGTHWVNSTPTPSRYSTATTLGASGSVNLDPTLGDVFLLSPTANVTIVPLSYPAGAHITLVITTVNASGFTVNFSGHEMYDGDLVLPKQSGVTVSISFIGDGTNFNLVSRAADRQNKVLGTTGGVSVSPTFAGVFTCTPTNDITFSATYAPPERKIYIIITTSGTTSRTMTFTTNFKTTGTLATGTVSGAVFVLAFIGDGTNFNEVSRSGPLS